MGTCTSQFQIDVGDVVRRWAARVAVTGVVGAGFVLSAPLLGYDNANAGLSGPGGPRLNYDYMPRIEDYEPRTEDEHNGHQPPRVPRADPPPGSKSQPSPRTSKPPNVTEPGPHRRGNRNALRPPGSSPAPPSQQAAPNANALPRSHSRSARPGPNVGPPNATPKGTPPSAGAQRKQILTRLYGYLSEAKDKSQAARFAASIEQLWLHSGSPTTDILMKRADRAIETGRWRVAETFADAIVRLQPDYTEGWMRRALILYQRRKPTSALRDLRRVLTIEPNHFLALERIGAILESVGEDRSALEAYRKLKRLHPQAPGVDKRIEDLTRKVEGEQI